MKVLETSLAIHYLTRGFSFATADESAIEKVKLDIQIGPKAAAKIIRIITMKDEAQTPEGKTVLLKLKKILDTGIVRRFDEQVT